VSLQRPATPQALGTHACGRVPGSDSGCVRGCTRREINWDSYWTDVHIPGLRRYVMGQPVVLPIPMLRNRSAQPYTRAGQRADPASHSGHGAGHKAPTSPANNIVQGPILPAHSHPVRREEGSRKEAHKYL
jgi:hypothetical protein